MSSHRLSVSGERPYTITAGGGPFSAVQYPSKPDDLAVAQVNPAGGGRTEIQLPVTVTSVAGHETDMRIEKRRYKSKNAPGWDIAYVLVLEHLGVTIVAEPAPGVAYGAMHTNVDVRRLEADRGNHPIDQGRQYDVLEVLPIKGDASYEFAEGELTEANLINAMTEDGIEASAKRRPTALAVADRTMKYKADRILNEPGPAAAGKQFTKLAGLEVVIDDSLGEHEWKLVYPSEK